MATTSRNLRPTMIPWEPQGESAGGSHADQALGIALDAAGDAYITAITYSSDYPVTPGAAQQFLRGSGDFLRLMRPVRRSSKVSSAAADGRFPASRRGSIRRPSSPSPAGPSP
jgi:hypothetical protein